jgi:hypothetical protein
MSTAVEAALSERRMVAAGLRLWPAAVDPAERALTSAAVELVIRFRRGEFADPGWPWVREGMASDPLGLFWLDVEAMTAWNGGRPEHPVMHFVEALTGGRPVRRLGQLLRVLDGSSQRLVMTAFHFAAMARRDVAVYAFGGDPWQLLGASARLVLWQADELDQLDRPRVALRPRFKFGAVR